MLASCVSSYLFQPGLNLGHCIGSRKPLSLLKGFPVDFLAQLMARSVDEGSDEVKRKVTVPEGRLAAMPPTSKRRLPLPLLSS